MHPNIAKQKLSRGKSVIGVGAGLGCPLATEALSRLGFDFVLVDNQHGAWSDDSSMHAFRTIALGNATPFVRVQSNDYYVIGRALDRGALGIVVPMVNSVEDAVSAARAVRYPPFGGRSIGPFGTDFLGADYRDEVDSQVYLAVQIESQAAVERAVEILSVQGVDGCWVGPDDLAASMGVEPGTREHEAAILSVLDVCEKAGKVAGIAAWPHTAQRWLDVGFRFVTIGPESGLMMSRAQQVLDGLRLS